MKITIKYFALLKEYTLGVSEETLMLNEGTDIKTLYKIVTKKYNFIIPYESILVALNKSIITQNLILKDGDEIAFLPPVSGG